jgi:hypothetical protein
MAALPPPVRCQIIVRGVLSDTLLMAFPSLHAETQGGVTVLEGELADQSALFGVVAQIEALALELVEIRRLKP